MKKNKNNEEEKEKNKKKKSRNKSSLNLDNVKEITIEEKGTKKEKAEKKKLQEKHAQKVRKTNNDKKHEEIMNNMINKRKKRNIIVLSLLFIFIILIVLSTIFALINLNNENLLRNMYVGEISISNIPKEEAINILNNTFKEISDKPIILKLDDYTREITPNEINFKIQAEKTVAKAYNIGRTTNIFKNNFTILNSYLKKNNISIKYTYNKELLEQILKDVSVKIPNKTIESTYIIKEDKLIINKGKAGQDVIIDDLNDKIINTFINLKTNITLTIPTKETTPEPINLEKISKEITKDVKDATYDEKTKKITPEVIGIKFAIPISKAEEILFEEKDKYIIPLKLTKPKITTNDLKNKYNLHIFNDLLAKETTHYDATNINRSINMEVSSKQINGTIIKPGEEFSFNSFVGNTVEADGYKLSVGYAGGRAVPMMGGGVCQISSAIYATALKVNLQITERFNHVCPVSYLPPGLDATTALGSCDLRFINNRNYPIKLIINTANGVSTVEIRGVKEKDDPIIKLTSTKLNTVPYTTSYIYDYSLKPGEKKVEVQGLAGFTSELYKETYINGVLINKELVSVDTYKPLNEVIRINE